MEDFGRVKSKFKKNEVQYIEEIVSKSIEVYKKCIKSNIQSNYERR
jgi:hypothetical protein